MSNVIDFAAAQTRYILGLRPLVQDWEKPSYVVPSDRDVIRQLSAEIDSLRDRLSVYERKAGV